MADDRSRHRGPDQQGLLEEELDQYVVKESPFQEFLMEQLRRAPWWVISFLVHVLALLIMWKWPYKAMADYELFTPIEVDLVAEQLEPEFQEEQIEIPEEPEEVEVPIEDIPISPEPPTLEEPGPELDLPPEDELVKDVERPVPSIDPPSATPVFAVDGPSRLNRGIYSGRNLKGRKAAVGGRGGTTTHAESAVMAGLKWLAKAQEKDGSWNAKNWEGRADYSVGMTGLALLAFLGAGYTDQKGPFKTTVARGLHWLQAHQKPDGRFPWQTFYEQGIATMAVSEAYGLTRNPRTGRMAQSAISYVCKVQPDHGGFRYGGAVPKGEGDMSVTGWQIMSIKSGICAELNVPKQAVDRSRVYLRNSWREYGRSAYIVSAQGGGSHAVTAIGLLSRIFIGGDEYADEIGQASQYLLGQEMKDGKPVPGGRSGQLVNDLYYTYYAALGMFQIGGEVWANWNAMFRDPLVKAQVHKQLDERGRFVRGSWDPKNHKWAKEVGGRVYATAMAILSLEVYYRFLPVYKQ